MPDPNRSDRSETSPQGDRVDQLLEANRQASSELGTLGTDVGVLLRRVEALEKQLQASQAIQAKLADRLEQQVAAQERFHRVEALEKQMSGALASQVQIGERIDRVSGQLDRLGRAETAIGQLRTEIGLQLAEQTHTARAELAAAAHQRAEDSARIAREVQALVGRVDAIDGLYSRLASVERQQPELSLDINRLSARIEEAGSERLSLTDTIRRFEQQIASRLEGFATDLAALRGEVDTWRAAINGHTETVREARGVADLMRAETAEIRREQRAVAEAERVFEGRVNGLLEALRQESAAVWDQFKEERRRDWQKLAKASDEREAMVQQTIADERGASVARDEALGKNLTETANPIARNLHDLRRDVARMASEWYRVASVVAERHAADLPSEEAPADLAERRQALRDDLRSRRPRPEGQ